MKKINLLLMLFIVTIGCGKNNSVTIESCSKTIYGFYPSWWSYKYPPSTIDFNNLTHVGHAFVWPTIDGHLEVPNGYIDPNLNNAVHAASGKIFVSIGGGSNSDGFSPMVDDPNLRDNFIKELYNFIIDNKYDGADIDWEFPKSDKDRTNLSLLIKEMRDTFGDELDINIAIPVSDWDGKWFDITEIAPYIKYFLVMTYDLHGRWSSLSGHNAPLYPSVCGSDWSVSQAVDYWLGRRICSSKMLIGIAFFGKYFDSEGLCEPFDPDTCSEAHYSEIVDLIGSGWTRHWDNEALVPYLTKDEGQGFWTYDDSESNKEKCNYALTKELAGVMIWELTGDVINGKHQLLPEIDEYLTHSDTNRSPGGKKNNDKGGIDCFIATAWSFVRKESKK